MRETENGFIEGWAASSMDLAAEKLKRARHMPEGTSRGGMHGN